MAIKPISELSLGDLMRRRDEVMRLLAQREPELTAELHLINQALGKFEGSDDKPYAKVAYPREAILLCLERSQAWMTKDQIQHELEVGGMNMNPKTFRGLLTAALIYHTKTNTIVRRDENGVVITKEAHTSHARYPKAQFGLPAWAGDPTIESFVSQENSK